MRSRFLRLTRRADVVRQLWRGKVCDYRDDDGPDLRHLQLLRCRQVFFHRQGFVRVNVRKLPYECFNHAQSGVNLDSKLHRRLRAWRLLAQD